MSIYALKPRFQALLRPVAVALERSGVTANQVTIIAAAISIAVGAFVAWHAPERTPFLLIPIWMFARIALNALDGMLAREFNQESRLGAYLNELGDVISDAALYAPFAWLPPFSGFGSPWSLSSRSSPNSRASWVRQSAHHGALTVPSARAIARSLSARSDCGSGLAERFPIGSRWRCRSSPRCSL